VAKTDLAALLDQLDEETRVRWGRYLERIEAEISEKGPAAAREHLEAALEHLLAVGWTLHRCFADEESSPVMKPLGEAASTVENLRMALDLIPRKPEWSQ
jgi:hypothetical protein